MVLSLANLELTTMAQSVVDKIPPGPKLDALKAEKVFGWKNVHKHDGSLVGKKQDKAGRWRLGKVPLLFDQETGSQKKLHSALNILRRGRELSPSSHSRARAAVLQRSVSGSSGRRQQLGCLLPSYTLTLPTS
jgi:hypothetical protein